MKRNKQQPSKNKSFKKDGGQKPSYRKIHYKPFSEEEWKEIQGQESAITGAEIRKQILSL